MNEATNTKQKAVHGGRQQRPTLAALLTTGAAALALLGCGSAAAPAAPPPGIPPVLSSRPAAAAGSASAAGPRSTRTIPALHWVPRSDWVSVKAAFVPPPAPKTAPAAVAGAASPAAPAAAPLVVPPAVGDGVADDTAAIQQAFSAIKTGSVVYFPPGTYRITAMLNISGRLGGVQLIGSGRDTHLVWDGEVGGKMIKVNGFARSQVRGLSFDGGGKAAVGLWYDSDGTFMTQVVHRDLAFHGFSGYGILDDPDRRVALSEAIFENCLFEECGTGISFVRHNDYDFTFDGCEFRRCGTGIESGHGNFYARNCHFEDSAVADITESSEHDSSVRRCTSLRSNMFIHAASGVAPIVVQDCRVDGWKSATGAILFSGAPMMLFDCVFSNPQKAGNPPVFITQARQHLVSSCNRHDDSTALVGGGAAQVAGLSLTEIPPGKLNGVTSAADQSFLSDKAELAPKIFDAKVDFGARGDGRTDDSDAIQKAIDAAAAAGKGSLAYLPLGNYVVSKTLHIGGRDFAVGGNGWSTQLLWKGPAEENTIEVDAPQNVMLQDITLDWRAAGPSGAAADVRQLGTGKASRMTYDGVSVFGIYQKQPLVRGLRFADLGAADVVLLKHVQGNIGFTNCARATIVGNCTFEGSVTVQGNEKIRDGELGFQTRLGTLVTYGLYVKNSYNFVASDFYMEQSDNHFSFQGDPDDPPGRVTVQGAKMQMTTSTDPTKNNVIDIDNYHGQIFFGPYQFYTEPKEMRIKQQGDSPVELFLLGCSWYDSEPDIRVGPHAAVDIINNQAVGMHTVHYDAHDVLRPTTLSSLSSGLDDLRRLGQWDQRLNHSAQSPVQHP